MKSNSVRPLNQVYDNRQSWTTQNSLFMLLWWRKKTTSFPRKSRRIHSVEKPQFLFDVIYYSYLFNTMPWPYLFCSCVNCALLNFGSFLAGDFEFPKTKTSVGARIVNTDSNFSYRCYSSDSSLRKVPWIKGTETLY